MKILYFFVSDARPKALQKTQQENTMSNLRILSRRPGRPSNEQEKEESRTRKPEKSESGAVVEMKLPIGAFESVYLTGTTLLMLADGRVLFDKDGTPVLSSEYYHVTAQGIQRVA